MKRFDAEAAWMTERPEGEYVYFDDVAPLVEALTGFVEQVEHDAQCEANRGGQQVPNFGDFAHVLPSTRSRLNWWALLMRAALEKAGVE